ncbi:MAG: GNAT family N-acetyltransferase [Erysipelotrichia bacterium]|nr:GNAT family N-acetyltransferase [Erysipelotrichia bacterium]
MKYTLRKLTENDLEVLMEWRMREDIASTMFTDVKLTLEGQKKWFEDIQKDSTQIRWIIFADDFPIGSMYFTNIDYQNRRCESGWFVAEKSHRSLQLAMALQQNSFDFAFNVLMLNRIYGYVIDTNLNVVRLLKLCGIQEEGILRQHVMKDSVFHDVYCVGITKSMWSETKEKFSYPIIQFEL